MGAVTTKAIFKVNLAFVIYLHQHLRNGAWLYEIHIVSHMVFQFTSGPLTTLKGQIKVIEFLMFWTVHVYMKQNSVIMVFMILDLGWHLKVKSM